MQLETIARQRLFNQRLLTSSFQQPVEVVQWLGAAQAQDFAGAKWSLGMRLDPAAAAVSDAAVEQAFDAGTVLRTHVLRPTWHFVAPADIRWLLALTAPRVHLLNATYYRRVGLDDDLYARSREVMIRALAGSTYQTRDELRQALDAAHIAEDVELRMIYILIRAELDGLICSGPRRGKQFTYALLDERVPSTVPLGREEALAELVRRYYTSHGPATAYDLARWASLTLEDVRAGLAATSSHLQSEEVEGQTYWYDSTLPAAAAPSGRESVAYLLSIYDEYVIGYKEWSAIASAEDAARLRALANDLTSVVLVDGRIVGTWKRAIDKRRATVTLRPLRPLEPEEMDAIAAAADRLGAFLGLPVTLIEQ
ncbi:MAG: winged helix DNA-binding domain-containing protein [Caldilineaceae bacterium]